MCLQLFSHSQAAGEQDKVMDKVLSGVLYDAQGLYNCIDMYF